TVGIVIGFCLTVPTEVQDMLDFDDLAFFPRSVGEHFVIETTSDACGIELTEDQLLQYVIVRQHQVRTNQESAAVGISVEINAADLSLDLCKLFAPDAEVHHLEARFDRCLQRRCGCRGWCIRHNATRVLYGNGYGEPELLIDFAYFRIVWTLEVSRAYQLNHQTALFRPLE